MQMLSNRIPIGPPVAGHAVTLPLITRFVLPLLLGLGLALWSYPHAWASVAAPQGDTVSAPTAAATAPPLGQPWVATTSDDASPQLNLYFFWTTTCPHCRAAVPFIETLEAETEWLIVHSYELGADPSHAQHYQELAAQVGEPAQYVPAFIFCEQMLVGFDTSAGTGAQIADALQSCYADTVAHYTAAAESAALSQALSETGTQSANGTTADGVTASGTTAQWRAAPLVPADAQNAAQAPAQPAPSVTIPLIGTVAAQQLSLPMLTIVLAGMDAFNPCAFFVLLFLLSLVVHARSRRRMAVIGGIFVFFSGALYFVFMAAWLNIFLWLGELAWITLIAGILAVTFGLLNLKDYFFSQRGPSLSIPAQARPTLFGRMRGLLQAGTWPALIGGTIVLAVSANAYELLCTAGFPMVFTRVLTMHALSTPAYYTWLLAYVLIYMLPLVLIVTLFTIRFNARKLREDEGRVLKLLSGSMMLLMGGVLIFAPAWMNRAEIAGGLLVAAGLITYILYRVRPPAAPVSPLRGAAHH